MAVFIVLWPYLLTTKLKFVIRHNLGHSKLYKGLPSCNIFTVKPLLLCLRILRIHLTFLEVAVYEDWNCRLVLFWSFSGFNSKIYDYQRYCINYGKLPCTVDSQRSKRIFGGSFRVQTSLIDWLDKDTFFIKRSSQV